MNKRILIIDENTKELRRLREVLAKEGFNIITASDTKTALQLCRHLEFEFLLGRVSDLGFLLEEKGSRENDEKAGVK